MSTITLVTLQATPSVEAVQFVCRLVVNMNIQEYTKYTYSIK